MSETIQAPAPPVFAEEPPITVRRAFQPDITHVEEWLMPRLQALYPDSSLIAIRSAIVNACVSNEAWVGVTANAIIAVRVLPENLTGAPFAKVWFALGKNGEKDAEEIAELHAAVVRWMKMADIKQMLLSPHTDCHGSYITKRIGGRIQPQTLRSWHVPEG